MIRWDCNFDIPDSTVQLATALIKIVSYDTMNGTTRVLIEVLDESNQEVLNSFEHTLNVVCSNEQEVYTLLLGLYTPSSLV